MNDKTLYDTLGIDKEASPEVIKKAYRKKSAVHHPDKQGGTEEAQRKVNHAYAILKDSRKRNIYDETGEENQSKSSHEAQAYSTITNYLNTCIQQFGDTFKYQDIILVIKDSLKVEIKQSFKNRRDFKAQLIKNEETRFRFTYNGKNADPIQGFFQSTEKSIKSQLELEENKLRVMLRARQLLEGHSFRSDAQPQAAEFTLTYNNLQNPFGRRF